ncbi:MAG: Fic family protein [Pseudomonadota bacterium]
MHLQSLTVTPELLRLIAEIDDFRNHWQEQQHQTPERLSALRQVATIESIGSSTRIEGVKLNDAQIESLLNQVHKTSFTTRDEQEVAGYAEAMDLIFANHAQIPITENYLKQLHATLLRHAEKDAWRRGEYKKHTNHVEAFAPDGTHLGVVFATSTPFETPTRIQELLLWTRETLADNGYHPLLVTAIFHVVFLAIHPFQDGNGRLARILTSLLLLKTGYHYTPYASLESIIEKNKEAYYLALQRTQKTLQQNQPDWQPWLGFFLHSLKRQKDHLAAKLHTSNSYTELPRDSMLIMQHVDQHQRITLKDATTLLPTTARSTIKKRLTDLVACNLLVRHGKARGTWYSKQ